MAVTNVLTDVARKRALDGRDLIPATFWMRAAVTVCFGVVLLWQILRGTPVVIRDGGALFGLSRLHFAPIPERSDGRPEPPARRTVGHHEPQRPGRAETHRPGDRPFDQQRCAATKCSDRFLRSRLC